MGDVTMPRRVNETYLHHRLSIRSICMSVFCSQSKLSSDAGKSFHFGSWSGLPLGHQVLERPMFQAAYIRRARHTEAKVLAKHTPSARDSQIRSMKASTSTSVDVWIELSSFIISLAIVMNSIWSVNGGAPID